jgi:hypothetical protein
VVGYTLEVGDIPHRHPKRWWKTLPEVRVSGVKYERDHAMAPAPQPQSDYGPDYSEDGVDLTLIRWMLSLTPAERLQVLERHVNAILAIRSLNAGQ